MLAINDLHWGVGGKDATSQMIGCRCQGAKVAEKLKGVWIPHCIRCKLGQCCLQVFARAPIHQRVRVAGKRGDGERVRQLKRLLNRAKVIAEGFLEIPHAGCRIMNAAQSGKGVGEERMPEDAGHCVSGGHQGAYRLPGSNVPHVDIPVVGPGGEDVWEEGMPGEALEVAHTL